MTKEDVLYQHEDYIHDFGWGLSVEKAKKALDEWSDHQCIAFANFIAQHNYKPHDIDTWDEGRKNTHEVYDDFIEFQRIEQQNKDNEGNTSR